MEKVYSNHNRFKLLNSIMQKESNYFIACLDVIKFREINDKYGVLEGDKVLKEIIEYIDSLDKSTNYKVESCIYEKDIIIITIDCSDEDKVKEIIEKIVFNKYYYELRFRVGYRQINNSEEVIAFIENAKNIIRNKKYEALYTIDNTFNLVKDIERYVRIKDYILNNKEDFFYLVYQPKVSVKTKRVESCEVLSRCRNKELGNIFPSEFLPIITDLNYQYEFDLFIFKTMCKEISDLKDYIRKFSVNFSVHTITKSNVSDEVLKLVEEYNVEPKDITIEILEDVCYDKNNIIYENINKLSNIGFNISIDDFGTGYSSYYRLASLKFSEIKIPREFLMLEQDLYNIENKNILSAIIEFCKKIECKVVSEGVETEKDNELMKKLGVDYIQGYFYSKPLEKSDFIEFILNFNYSS